MTEFEAAPLDMATRATTMFFVGTVALVTMAATIGSGQRVAAITIPLAAGVVIGSAWGFAPRTFEVGGGRLRVRRQVFGTTDFAIEGPAVAWEPSRFGLGGLRLAGSGGAFGWYGSFWRRDLGRYRAYVTDRSRLVSVPTDRGLVVLSPAEPDRFLRAVGS